MCGIIGRLGGDNAVPYLINGLKSLEYRGYDSSGIALIKNSGISTVRASGKLTKLMEKIENQNPSGGVGIGHTRWATHGEPNEKNAHPHLSEDGRFAVVHNGIIENAGAIKQKYPVIAERCVSDTDTEVIAQLLQYFYTDNVLEAIEKTIAELHGSFAVGILCTDIKDSIFCSALSSPLVAALGESGGFIASDVSALAPYADYAYFIADGEICVLSKSSVSFYDRFLNPLQKQAFKIEADMAATGKHGYEHYMLLEIMQQPEAVKNTLLPLIRNNKICIDCLKDDGDFIKNELNRVVFIACGSACHVGITAEMITERLCKIPCSAEIASEFRYSDPCVDKNTLAVFISQSGETADTLAALRLAKEKGAKTLSIVNVRGSAAAKESARVIYTNAGREVAVATTKAYSAQLAAVYALGLYLAEKTEKISEKNYYEAVQELTGLPEKIRLTLNSCNYAVQKQAAWLCEKNDMFFVGRQLDYAAALEGSLKMKEISYIHSEAYAAGELKHGTISLIEQGTPVIAVIGQPEVLQKTQSNVREVLSRGAKTLIITQRSLEGSFNNEGTVIAVEDTLPLFAGSLLILPLQLLSYYTAKLKGCDIDMPKNLAKSVTVE